MTTVLGEASVTTATEATLKYHNIRAVQRESAAMGVISGASVFLPVFLLRLGGTTVDVSLLTAIPAFGGFLLSIPAGAFLQRRRNVIPWYASTRGLYYLTYAGIAVLVGLLPPNLVIPAILGLWAIATVPATVSAVASNVILNVAGPSGRYDLVSRRYGIAGLTTGITVLIAGQALERIAFPTNYQAMFIVLVGFGLVGCLFALRIVAPDHEPERMPRGVGLVGRVAGYVGLLRAEPRFLAFVSKRFFLTFGTSLAAVMLPLWLIREADAPDSWVGIIGTSQALAALGGYFVWRRLARQRSGRSLLAATTFGIAFAPFALAASANLGVIAAVAAYSAFMAAGLNLVLFDELMKTVPEGRVVTFSGVDSAVNNLTLILGPLVGAVVAESFSIFAGLIVAGAATLFGATLLTVGTVRAGEGRVAPAAGLD